MKTNKLPFRLNDPPKMVYRSMGVAEFGGTFSRADINNMLHFKWKEHRATASGQGEMNYIMRTTPKADPAGLRLQINRVSSH